ncbi:hypothetical protein SAMN05443575_0310 [Jatrophihabitans endophyticus]|uniref:Uncharacterized protein n=1 Tax=Jatrophihabitans endophyticus TaxID=1206085 RepID=A0A1M5CPJ9_9ACTN|nr:hypothetical protein [Jatrophihabitans endophyticus]SHF56675.1 hypothetical protein SAMN05443575_0310 [Jatrophihabitans endophyticus]
MPATPHPTTAPVGLDAIRDNVAMTGADELGAGGLNVWRNSLPAGTYPGAPVEVDGVPFTGSPHTGPDNVRCAGQTLPVEIGRWDWLWLLATGERRVEDEIAMLFTDGAVDLEAVRVSDFWAAPAAFGETVAFRSEVMHYPHHVQSRLPGTIWCQRVPITRRADLVAIRLPDNLALHVFAATLLRCDR